MVRDIFRPPLFFSRSRGVGGWGGWGLGGGGGRESERGERFFDPQTNLTSFFALSRLFNPLLSVAT